MTTSITVNVNIESNSMIAEGTALYVKGKVEEAVKEHLEFSTLKELEKAKPKFPKWEDLEDVQGYFTTARSRIHEHDGRIEEEDKNVWPTKELAEASLALSELLQYRDYVNEGWKYGVVAYFIKVADDRLSYAIGCRRWEGEGHLVFPTRELAEGFLEAYKPLIIKAQPLLLL
jgi:hypothetical protein